MSNKLLLLPDMILWCRNIISQYYEATRSDDLWVDAGNITVDDDILNFRCWPLISRCGLPHFWAMSFVGLSKSANDDTYRIPGGATGSNIKCRHVVPWVKAIWAKDGECGTPSGPTIIFLRRKNTSRVTPDHSDTNYRFMKFGFCPICGGCSFYCPIYRPYSWLLFSYWMWWTDSSNRSTAPWRPRVFFSLCSLQVQWSRYFLF